MQMDRLKEAVELASKISHVFVATVNEKGCPHIAAAGKLVFSRDDCLAVTSWFCPQTVLNFKKNQNVSLVVWDSSVDHGYQIGAKLLDTEEVGILDGFTPEFEDESSMPQVQRQLLLKPQLVIEFKHAWHSDT